MAHKYVLDELRDDDLKVFLVWGPMLGGEQESDARKATLFLPDERVEHFWTPKHGIAEQFSEPLVLRDEKAWDTFNLYAPGAGWSDGPPPVPIYYMHVGRSLPADRRFNGQKLAMELRRILGKARPGGAGEQGEGHGAHGAQPAHGTHQGHGEGHEGHH